jgi:Lrp/AsnC family leucine-responsive transcriptional regulator
LSKDRSTLIDETDLKILMLLQEDAKMGVKKIAEQVGKGISTIHARIKSMEQKKIITKYTAVLDPQLLNRSIQAFIFIGLRTKTTGGKGVLSQKKFCMEIAQHPYVQGVYLLSGEFDVILKVRAKSVDEMKAFIVDHLREMPTIERTQTTFVLENYLETLELKDLER